MTHAAFVVCCKDCGKVVCASVSHDYSDKAIAKALNWCREAEIENGAVAKRLPDASDLPADHTGWCSCGLDDLQDEGAV